MTLKQVPMSTLPLPAGAPAPNAQTCWKTDDAPGSTNPMEHCTYERGHDGLHTWERCTHRGRRVLARCKRKVGHLETHLYGPERWAPGYPTKPTA